MLGRRGLKFEVVDLPPREMIGAYKQVDLVICQMLHSSILATNAGVPSLNIGYDVKNASFYDLMGLPELCIPHSEVSPERLVSSFADLLGRRAEIAIQLDRSKAFLLGEMQAFIEEIARLDSVASSARSAVEPTKVAPAIQA
jgi:polysaccharide pyruvyl transferase WcaK-like protein